jgi:hypothetical protein
MSRRHENSIVASWEIHEQNAPSEFPGNRIDVFKQQWHGFLQ